MTCRMPRARSGITLTEILISILILAVGMVSLATLFPIGLIRLRDAQRNNRSVLLTRSAIAEIQGRDLFNNDSFTRATMYGFDPWTFDSNVATNVKGVGANQGLPVAYDPLWYDVVVRNPLTAPVRFAVADPLDMLPNDPVGGLPASAFGLQRITNFLPGFLDRSIFVSMDDIVFQTDRGAMQGPVGGNNASPLVPVITGGKNLENDFAYSWMFTGYVADVNDFTRFEGSIVVFNNRPFGLDANGLAAGERVVEAIFGYGRPLVTGPSTGDRRLVLLRWPNNRPDPEVAIGGWIADVTYEINQANSLTKVSNGFREMQRCNWYRVIKRTPPVADPANPAMRRMIVTVSTPVLDPTTLQAGTDSPAVTNAALLMPSVVNVFPWVFVTRN